MDSVQSSERAQKQNYHFSYLFIFLKKKSKTNKLKFGKGLATHILNSTKNK